MKKIFWLIVIVVLALTFIPIRPVPKMPETSLITVPSLRSVPHRTDASLWRLLKVETLEEGSALRGFSIFLRDHPADRLALAQGFTDDTRLTVYFDGWKYVGAVADIPGQGVYYDYKGRSPEELDGWTLDQWAARNIPDYVPANAIP
ncbi:MAG: hypothetical protein ACOX88_06285 [Christensenellales bacterium]|jgi:hypothetical protein